MFFISIQLEIIESYCFALLWKCPCLFSQRVLPFQFEHVAMIIFDRFYLTYPLEITDGFALLYINVCFRAIQKISGLCN